MNHFSLPRVFWCCCWLVVILHIFIQFIFRVNANYICNADVLRRKSWEMYEKIFVTRNEKRNKESQGLTHQKREAQSKGVGVGVKIKTVGNLNSFLTWVQIFQNDFIAFKKYGKSDFLSEWGKPYPKRTGWKQHSACYTSGFMLNQEIKWQLDFHPILRMIQSFCSAVTMRLDLKACTGLNQQLHWG